MKGRCSDAPALFYAVVLEQRAKKCRQVAQAASKR